MLEKILAAIKTEQAKFAEQVLLRPTRDNPAYDYGHATGTYQGLERAVELIKEVLEAADEYGRRDI